MVSVGPLLVIAIAVLINAIVTSNPVDNIGITENDIISQSQLWSEDSKIKMLAIGRLGTGKSTLVRSLFGKDGHKSPPTIDESRHKPTFNENSLVINGVPLSIMMWNQPKMDDLNSHSKSELDNYDIILYVIKMSDTRFQPQDGILMRTLIKTFGIRFINKTLFILSYANQVGYLDGKTVYQKTKENLASKTLNWKERIHSKLSEHSGVNLPHVDLVHAGHPLQPKLYDLHWPSKVLEMMFYKLNELKRPALARACEKYMVDALRGKYDDKPGGCNFDK